MVNKLTIQERIQRMKNHHKEIVSKLNDDYAMAMHNLLREWENEKL